MLKKVRPTCRVCGLFVARQNYKFCSNKCQIRERHLLYIERWLRGEEHGLQSPFGVSNYIRRYLIEQNGEKCCLCGWAQRHPVTGVVPVQVDHIDGNWLNCRPENLRLLCPNCHSLTPNFGNLNRGNGRSQRHRTK